MSAYERCHDVPARGPWPQDLAARFDSIEAGEHRWPTPWGWHEADLTRTVADGVLRVTTPGHGGLLIRPDRWQELPGAVRGCMISEGWAEEDCEEAIVSVLLGVEPSWPEELPAEERRAGMVETALGTARYFDRYAPCVPWLEFVERTGWEVIHAGAREACV